ncbi:MAG: hypothetical protein ACM358_00605, partial [Gemmatimonadota bacterium]
MSYLQIAISWRDNSTNESGFEVHRSTSGASGVFSILASTAAGVTSLSDNGLTPSSEFCYKIRAFRTIGSKKGSSAFSNTPCATTPPPPAPSNTDARPLGSTTVEVTWVDNTTIETGFRLERSIDHGASWMRLITTAPSAARASDFGRSAESPELCYRVIAVASSGESAPSNTDCTTPPAAPTNL